MKPISQKASLYLRKRLTGIPDSPIITITSLNKKSRGKRYQVEEGILVDNLLAEFSEKIEKVIEKHGEFIENGKKVYYK